MENNQIGTYYRTGGKLTHCGCECLPGGKDIDYIVIRSIEFKKCEEIGGRKENNVWVAHFAPNPYTNLPMVLNATNRKRIFKLYPECNGYIDLLKDIPVRLTKEKCRDAQDGGDTWGLRISKMKPKIPQGAAEIRQQYQHPASAPQKQELLVDDEATMAQAVKYLKEGGSMEAIRSKYTVSAETEAELVKRTQEA